MSHLIAGIDVHKKMLAVVIADVGGEGVGPFQHRRSGATPEELRVLGVWLAELGVQEVVMESTAQYWKPVWQELEGRFHLELAQAQSNRGARGRKSDFLDAERLVRRYAADELTLSYVPDPEQRLWRTLSRTKQRWCREKSRLQSRLEALLEEMRIKLSSVVSDLLGVSARRMLEGIAKGETDAQRLAEMADPNLRAGKEQLCNVLQAVGHLDPRYRRVLKQYLDQLELNERQVQELEVQLAESLQPHAEAVERLAEIPGLGVDSAQQIIAEIGPAAEKFPSAGDLSSWVGTCPGQDVSAEKSGSEASPKGNQSMRSILDQAANAAVKAKGTVFEARYKRLGGRDPKRQNLAVWAVAHHLCRVVWKILHAKVRYEERGNRNNPRADKRRAARLLRELKLLGYQVKATPLPSEIRA
jgi:transposase